MSLHLWGGCDGASWHGPGRAHVDRGGWASGSPQLLWAISLEDCSLGTDLPA